MDPCLYKDSYEPRQLACGCCDATVTQLFGSMFSPVAWSVVTTALLALASTALPPPLSDGSIIPRSYKTKMSWQDRLLAKKEEASNIKYIDCLEEWVSVSPPGLDM